MSEKMRFYPADTVLEVARRCVDEELLSYYSDGRNRMWHGEIYWLCVLSGKMPWQMMLEKSILDWQYISTDYGLKQVLLDFFNSNKAEILELARIKITT